MPFNLPKVKMPLPVVVPDSAAATNKAVERGHWGSKAEFVLSCVGMSVGMGNVWRFPYQAFNNGGAAFLFPYLVLLFLIGKPMYFAECVLGQFSSLGPVSVYKFCPPFKGAGYAAAIISLFVALYYNMFMVVAFIYFAFCFSKVLPWSTCDAWWGADEKCYVYGTSPATRCPSIKAKVKNITINATSTLAPCENEWETAGQQFWEKYILNVEKGVTNIEHIGNIQWKILVALILSWILIFLCIARGIKTSGKIVYFTAIFPYVVLAILFIMGLTLDGSSEGLRYLFEPKWEKLTQPKSWTTAAGQMFYSLNVAYGGVIMFSSYNRFQNKVKTDALIVTTMDTLTSVIASIAIFSILGNMAHRANKDITEVMGTVGPSLAFEIVPQAVLNLGVPHLWCALFMLMLITLAIDSEFAYVETFLTAIYDEVPYLRKHKVITCALSCLVCCLIAISFTTQGGWFVLTFIDDFAAGYCALVVAIVEMISVFWVYGLRNFLDDAQFMLGKRPGWYWRICWTVIDPILLIVIFIILMWSFSPKQSDGTDYPGWALGLGWFLAAFSIGAIPICFAYYLIKFKCFRKLAFRDCFKPTEDWGPSDPYIFGIYKEWKAQEPRPGTQKRSLPNFEGLAPAPEVLQPNQPDLQTRVG